MALFWESFSMNVTKLAERVSDLSICLQNYSKYLAGQARSLTSRLFVHCWCQYYSATWFCSTAYPESSVVVVESEIWLADFRQVAPLCVINLINNLELTDMFRTKRRCNASTVIQISWDILEMWAVKRNAVMTTLYMIFLQQWMKQWLELRQTERKAGLWYGTVNFL